VRAHRLTTRRVRLGAVDLGRGAPIVVQSMTTTPTQDVRATLRQIRRLRQAGCELVRVAVPDAGAAEALPRLVRASPLPLVADIHFDARLAKTALAAGVAKIRINPGNLGLEPALDIGRAAARAGVAVRIGVNSGSVPERQRRAARSSESLGRLMARMAVRYAGAFERAGVRRLVLSVKSSEVAATLAAYRTLAGSSRLPLHLGLTEAGGDLAGAVKSAAALSPLLLEGIGDTLRISLTGDPVLEVRVAYQLLSALGLRRRGVEIIACPTCGRTRIDLERMLRRVEKAVADITQPLTLAVMGCVVNGPGEARHADAGLAGAPDGSFMLFAQGRPLRRVTAAAAVPALLAQVKKILLERGKAHAAESSA